MRPPHIIGEIGGSPGDSFDAALGASIAFFTASQSISPREKGFSRNSDIPSLSARNATAPLRRLRYSFGFAWRVSL